MDYKFTIVVPVYNEDENLERVEKELLAYTKIATKKTKVLFVNDGMDDTGCPLKVIKTEYAKEIPMFTGLHRFLPAMVLLQKGKVKQIPVQHFPRMAGTAKYGLWNRLIGPLIDCFVYIWMKKKYINYSISKKN